jgi:hypothetical protein
LEKIPFEHQLIDYQGVTAQISVGTMPHNKVLCTFEMFGTDLVPAVRKELTTWSVAGAEGFAAV